VARIPLILDVDTGIDDSLALLYAAASPEVELVAVTCCSGNVEARQVAINTLAILELAGRTDVEVALGREVPLVRWLETTPETHGPRGIGYAELPPPSRPLSARDGAAVVVEEARRRPGEITLLTLGPLTNLAVALEREPALPRLLRRFAFMGGAFTVPGNTTPPTEWHIHCDPDAARIVLRAWAAAIADDPSVPRPLGMGLDVTETARMLPEHVVALAHRAGSTPDPSIELQQQAADGDPLAPMRSVASNPLVRYVADALRWYFEFHRRYDGFYGAYVHDPFAIAAVLDPALVATEPLFVDVEVSGELTSGMTVADRRHLTGRPANVDVALGADPTTFLARLIDRVGDLAALRHDAARAAAQER
jgi:purine nucleosidase